MGCSSSSRYDHIYLTVPSVSKYKSDFNALGLSEIEIGQLYSLFCQIDTDSSQLIEIIELLMFLDVERTRFTKRIFSIFDDDKSGKIDFREFILSIWNYCTLGKISLILFAFDIYDQDKSGVIDVKEAQHMIKDVYGKKFEQNAHAKRVYAKIEELDRKNIDLVTFKNFAERHQALLYPAFEMQTRFQDRVLGSQFWQVVVQNRIRLYEDRYIPVRDIIARYEERANLKNVHSTNSQVELVGDSSYPSNNNNNNSTALEHQYHHQYSHHQQIDPNYYDNHIQQQQQQQQQQLQQQAISSLSEGKKPRRSSVVKHEAALEEEHQGITADGHESVKSLVRKQTSKTIAVAPITSDVSNGAESEVYPSFDKRKKSVAVNHGFTADGLTPQSSFSSDDRNTNHKSKLKSAAKAVSVTTEKKRKKSEFRH